MRLINSKPIHLFQVIINFTSCYMFTLLDSLHTVLAAAFGFLETRLQVEEYISWGGLSKSKLKKLNDKGIAVKSTDEYFKAAGLQRYAIVLILLYLYHV